MTPAESSADPLTRYIVLIRGINVGTSKRVAMAELRQLLTNNGYHGVRTHLNSGNVILDAPGPAADLVTVVRRVLRDGLAVPADVIVRTPDQLAAAMASDPLGDTAPNGSRHFLGFLAGKPASARVADVPELSQKSTTAPDVARLVGQYLYLWCPNGLSKSTFARLDWAKRLGTPVTMRNWNTVSKLTGMAG